MKNEIDRFERLEKKIDTVFCMAILSFGFTLLMNENIISMVLGIIFSGYAVINLFLINN